MDVDDVQLRNLLSIQEDWRTLLGMADTPDLSLREALSRMPSIRRHESPPARPSSITMPMSGGATSEARERLRAEVRERLGLDGLVEAEVLPEAERRMMDEHASQPLVEGETYQDLLDRLDAMNSSFEAAIDNWRNMLVRPTEMDAMFIIMFLLLDLARWEAERGGGLSSETAKLIIDFTHKRMEQALALSDLIVFIIARVMRTIEAGYDNDYTRTVTRLLSNVRASGLDQLLM